MMLKFGLIYVFLTFVFVRATENILNIDYAPRNICEQIDREWIDGNPRGLATENNLDAIKAKCENAGCVLLKKHALSPLKYYECVPKTVAYPILKRRNKVENVMRTVQYAVIPVVFKLPASIGVSLAVFFADLNLKKNLGTKIFLIACICEGMWALCVYGSGIGQVEDALHQLKIDICNKWHELKWIMNHGESSAEPPNRFTFCYSSDAHMGYLQKFGFVALPMLVEAIRTWFKNDFDYGTIEDDKKQKESFRLQFEESTKLFKTCTKEKLFYGGGALLNCVFPTILPNGPAIALLSGSLVQALPITQGLYVFVLTLLNILTAVVFKDVSDLMMPESFAYAWKFFLGTIVLRLLFVLPVLFPKKPEPLLNDD